MRGNHRSMRRLVQGATILVLTIVIVGLMGCRAPGTPAAEPVDPPPADIAPTPDDTLPFETIAQEAPLGDHPPTPVYAVMIKPDASTDWRANVPAEAVRAGREAARERDRVAILVFAGAKATSGYQITVDAIRRQGNQLIVTVSEQRPDEDAKVEPAMTLPYHVVAVPRDALPDPVTRVVFRNAEGTPLARRAYPSP